MWRVQRWRETIATAKEARIRDQAAFNMMTKMRRPEHLRVPGFSVSRLFKSTNGGDGSITLGLLPLSRYLNGHTFFVQRVDTLPEALPPLSVHQTYQFAEGAKFAHGKRQRLREKGLWLVDPDSYYNGRYLKVADAAANLPYESLSPSVDSRVAVKKHLAEARHRTMLLRALLGIAKATNRVLILPRMLCYCDFMWKEMQNCRVGGAERMRLPFDCPMDHVLVRVGRDCRERDSRHLRTRASAEKNERPPPMAARGHGNPPRGALPPAARCPLRPIPTHFETLACAPRSSFQDTPRWFENNLGVEVREPNFLQNPRVPANMSSSMARVAMPAHALNDLEVAKLLAPHASAPVIELDGAIGAFCGFADRSQRHAFESESGMLLHYKRTPFCMMEGSDNAPLFSQCCHPRKPGDKFFPCQYGFDDPEPLPACGAARV